MTGANPVPQGDYVPATRHGDLIRIVDHLREIDLVAEVCDPVFHDPAGEKLRA